MINDKLVTAECKLCGGYLVIVDGAHRRTEQKCSSIIQSKHVVTCYDINLIKGIGWCHSGHSCKMLVTLNNVRFS